MIQYPFIHLGMVFSCKTRHFADTMGIKKTEAGDT